MVVDPLQPSADPKPASVRQFFSGEPHNRRKRYLTAVALVILASAFNYIFHTRISPTNLVMPYFVMVVVCAIYLGRGPAILVSLLSVLAFDFFFVPPYLTLAVDDTEYLMTFLGLLVVGLVVSELTNRVSDQAAIARRRAEETLALYGLSRDLAAAADLQGILNAIENNVSRTFQREVIILLPDPAKPGGSKPFTNTGKPVLGESERAIAAWVLQNGLAAGRGTETFSSAQARYLPLQTGQGTVGVLGVQPQAGRGPLTPEQVRLLEAFASQTALAIERVLYAEQASQAQLLQATEKLQSALLNSISHDLRTPLVSITGALSSLREDSDALPLEIRQELIETAYDDAGRLNRLVANLLNMTRIEAGALQIDWEPGDVQDLIGSALQQLGGRLGDHAVQVQISEDLPLVQMDFVLMVQVLVNLLDNAAKYSPPGAAVEVQAQVEQDWMVLRVLDCGPGIPDEDLPHVFDKFYRVKRPNNVGGIGLGLAICKGIVDAHGGRIQAENRPGSGSVFTVWLPAGAGDQDG